MSEIVPTSKGEIVTGGSQALDQNPAAVYLARLTSDNGRRTQRQALDVMAGLVTGNADCLAFPWQELRYQHTAAIRAKLIEKYAPATCNKFLSALRGVLKEAWRLGLMSAEEYQRAADLASVTGSTIPAGRAAKQNEIYKLMVTCQNDLTAAGARDAAMISLLYACGVRRDELAHLRFENYDHDPEAGEGTLKILGKRNKERTVPVVNGAYDALADWLDVRGLEPGALFYAINKGGRLKPGQMTNQAVYNILQKRIEQAGIKNLSPHDLRRTFISDLLDSGADIATVARLAGHSNVQTTMRYDRRPEEAKRKAARLLTVPYTRRNKLPEK
jgi:integrase